MSIKVQWECLDSLNLKALSYTEMLLYCIAEANEAYREGEEKINDTEYDYLVEQANVPEITQMIGTALCPQTVKFLLIHENEAYMSTTRRSDSRPPKAPKIPPVFDSLVTDYAKFKSNNFENKIAPKAIPLDPHRQHPYRCWDTEQKSMDYGVHVVDGKLLIPATEEDNPKEWNVEETSIISGKYYFTMDLDEYFVLMEFSGTKDSSGKELYEGDIVQDSVGVKYYVVRDRYRNRWVLSTLIPSEWTPLTLSISIYYAEVATCVGNIYENA